MARLQFARLAAATAAWAELAGVAYAGSLADIDHVVLFMQENRAFDHYFGTMAGVRGFNDANLQMNNGVPVWHQKVTPQMTTSADYLLPWYINYLGGDYTESTQCMYAGGNGWKENHAAWNFGTNDHWAMNNTPYSIGFYKKQDLPTHFALAENWVVGDMYQESVVASTNPNRVSWISGSINVPGSPQQPNEGGNPYIDNNEQTGCEAGGINCFPLKWKTAGECYEDAGVTWSVFQDADNFDDNPYAWFDQFRNAKAGSTLNQKGIKGQSLAAFYDQAAKGTLPAVSYIVGPTQLSEHTPYSPNDGAWLQDAIARAVINSPKYSKTALIISYDETGGWADHVDPYRSPEGTPGEWINDPYGNAGHTFAGPGFRLPFYIISPWTRKGGVYTEHADHSSQILFVEKWQAAKGKNVKTDEMGPWRREHMGDLVNAFDFDNPDYSIPSLPTPRTPHKNAAGNYDGSSYCQAQYKNIQPPVPYTGSEATKDMASTVEHGFKTMRGMLTEGRYLVLETDGVALSNPTGCKKATVMKATAQHEKPAQRWIAHAQQIGGNVFYLQSFSTKTYLCKDRVICTDAASAERFEVQYVAGKGYTFKQQDGGKYLARDSSGKLSYGAETQWSIFSVSY